MSYLTRASTSFARFCDFRSADLNRRRASGAIRALASLHFLGRGSSSRGSWRWRCSRRRWRILLLGKHRSNKEKQRIPLGLSSLGKLLRTMLKENNKGKSEDREQGELEKRISDPS